jgi:5,6-dimethylbenzimidazole synthase
MNRQDPNRFTSEQRQAIYDVIYARRDIRSHFLPDAIEPEVLCRVLDAAHHAGSVGFMQPWNFLVVTDRAVRQRIHEVFLAENQKAAARFEGGRASLYRTLKLEGILESPANICVTCDRTRHGPEVLGRNSMRETDLYSTCCAIQNLWLAARAEGLGVGWVSILDPRSVKTILGIPTAYRLVAYLCVGYVEQFPQEPELQRAGWLQRMPLSQVAFAEQWGKALSLPAIDSAPSEKSS